MNKSFSGLRAAVLLAVAFVFAAVLPAAAQVVTQLPIYLNNNVGQLYDFGNGPLEFRLLQGSAQIFTSSSVGVGSTSGASTTLTLTATPTTPPCVGCIINGAGITAGTLVASYNGGLIVGLPTAATVPASSALAWGAACPATVGVIPVALLQAGVGADTPWYTQARLCGAAQFGAGATVLPFTIGAH